MEFNYFGGLHQSLDKLNKGMWSISSHLLIFLFFLVDLQFGAASTPVSLSGQWNVYTKSQQVGSDSRRPLSGMMSLSEGSFLLSWSFIKSDVRDRYMQWVWLTSVSVLGCNLQTLSTQPCLIRESILHLRNYRLKYSDMAGNYTFKGQSERDFQRGGQEREAESLRMTVGIFWTFGWKRRGTVKR